MKKDTTIPALINFLVPVIFLYGLFFLADIFEGGFFALIYAMVILVSSLMIFSVRASGVKFLKPIQFKIFSFSILMLSLVYVISMLVFVTSGFSI